MRSAPENRAPIGDIKSGCHARVFLVYTLVVAGTAAVLDLIYIYVNVSNFISLRFQIGAFASMIFAIVLSIFQLAAQVFSIILYIVFGDFFERIDIAAMNGWFNYHEYVNIFYGYTTDILGNFCGSKY